MNAIDESSNPSSTELKLQLPIAEDSSESPPTLAGPPAADDIFAQIQRRSTAVTTTLARILNRPTPGPRWGINE